METVATRARAAAQTQAFILAGGRGRRLGCDKARMLVGGEPLVRLLAARLAPHVAAVWLVGKRDQGLEDLGLPVVHDREAGRALVHGIRTALETPGPPWRFVVACDMPGVGADLLLELWRTAVAAGAPGCCLQKEGCEDVEPLPSLWHADLAAAASDSWGFGARAWVRRAGLAILPLAAAEAARLENLNTPEEWLAYRERGAERSMPT